MVCVVSLVTGEGVCRWLSADKINDDNNIKSNNNNNNNVKTLSLSRRRRQCVLPMFGARINNIMPRSPRFTGNALQTIFPPITRAAQGVMGGRRAVGHTPVGVGHPKAVSALKELQGGPRVCVA